MKEYADERTRPHDVHKQVNMLRYCQDNGIDLKSPVSGKTIRELIDLAEESGVYIPGRCFDSLSKRDQRIFYREMDRAKPELRKLLDPDNKRQEITKGMTSGQKATFEEFLKLKQKGLYDEFMALKSKNV